MGSLADRQAVYRCYGAGDELLYVGVTGQLGKRLGAHAEKIWFLEVQVITLEWYESRESAERAESVAITYEHPKHNIRHNGDQNLRRPRPLRPTPRIVLDDDLALDGIERVCQILRLCGTDSMSVQAIQKTLEVNGSVIHRATIYRWMTKGVKKGVIARIGEKPSSRYALVTTRPQGAPVDQSGISGD